ncbi:uncharacterized protein BT62DRAFT_1012894 [Guyanagaster necrorhizus]|uniref:F-box domain-containing protein n=1 Tax=Guyanagaster necrorhizus TaxID=856835 RepID=A0A9P8AMV8_9AGAR|nr:uncharacterized protein BT62DRAFT_1012894 [Guyanagaster necrorhizus MCA 3950]KAG7440242.1 hypothetical protein BT62DRAFT_1012894 [Guyanagaster necrorhizus MCA 3950]
MSTSFEISDNSIDVTPISSFFRHPTGILLTDLDKARFDKEIPPLERQVRYFDEQSAFLVSQRDPTRTLPKIFSHVTVDHDSLDLSSGPWTLGQVCALWRDLVLDTPLVWSRPTLKGVYTSQSLQVLAEYLRRSRDCPLHIKWSPDLREPFFEVLMKISPRWKFVHFVMPMEFLTHLSAQCGKNSPFGGGSNPAVDLFSNVPSLRKIGLHGLTFSEPMLTGNHVTHFAGELDHLDDIKTIFEFPALFECRLQYNGKDSVFPLSPIQNDRIKYLVVNITRILNVLTLPSLEHLEIDEQWGAPMSACTEAMSAFVDRSSSHLRSLSMTEIAVLKQFIHSYYAQTVEDFTVTIKLSCWLAAVFYPWNRYEFIPNLRRLRIRFWDQDEVHLHEDHVVTLVNFIRGRLDEATSVALGVKKLDMVHISSKQSSYLDQIRKGGLDESDGCVLEALPPADRYDFSVDF